jgi:hypothetical protein
MLYTEEEVDRRVASEVRAARWMTIAWTYTGALIAGNVMLWGIILFRH